MHYGINSNLSFSNHEIFETLKNSCQIVFLILRLTSEKLENG